MLRAAWEIGLIPDGEAGIDKTVSRMQQLVRDAVQDPRFVLTAQDMTVRAGNRPTRMVVEEVVRFVRGHWSFRWDPKGVEFVKTPDRLLAEVADRGVMVGDCDDASTLIASLLHALGYSTRFVVVQRDQQQPKPSYDHIYLEVWVDNGWLPIDGVAQGRPLFYEPQGDPVKRYAVN